MNRYLCEVRKRMIIEAKDFMDAKKKFAKIVETIELYPKARLVMKNKK